MKSNQFKVRIIVITIALLLLPGVVQANQRVLQQGMEGTDVCELQENLVMLGNRIMIDGIFGTSTKEAVIKFQQKSNLPADGVVGDETWQKLKESLSYDKYTVKKGDSLYELSIKHDISVEVIKEANHLDSNTIRIGQELIIPKTALGGGIDTDFYEIDTYKVQRGDTLKELARKHNTTVRTIKRVNDFETSQIKIGQKIKMPKLVTNLSHASRNVSRVKKGFIWPTRRSRISSNYGWRIHPISNKKHFHGGIDIAVRNGTSVRASKSGKVLSSGWIRGFGWTVTVDHGNGVVTLYAHNSKLLVRKGQRVRQGQTIAKSGNTGRSTGPHLDFRILINNKPVNPLKYLN